MLFWQLTDSIFTTLYNQSANGAEAHATIQRIALSDSIYPILCPYINVYIIISKHTLYIEKHKWIQSKSPNIHYKYHYKKTFTTPLKIEACGLGLDPCELGIGLTSPDSV